MQGCARGRKGERKTYHINPYHHITMEFGGYVLNVAKNPTRARAKRKGVLSYQKVKGIFDNPHVIIFTVFDLHPNPRQSIRPIHGTCRVKKRGNTPWMAIHESPSSRWSSSTMTSWSSRIWLDRCICHRKRRTSWGRVTVTCRTVWQFGLFFFLFLSFGGFVEMNCCPKIYHKFEIANAFVHLCWRWMGRDLWVGLSM